MKRRAFIAALGVAVAWPLAIRAQPVEKIFHTTCAPRPASRRIDFQSRR